MDISSLPGLPDGLAIAALCRAPATFTVSPFSTSVAACCPQCGTSAERVYSRRRSCAGSKCCLPSWGLPYECWAHR